MSLISYGSAALGWLRLGWAGLGWSGAVAAGSPVNLTLPTISGNAYKGSRLTGTYGTWSNSPTSYTVQWINSVSGPITGATSLTYVPQLSDVNDTLTLKVTAANSVGTGTAYSLAFGPISINPDSTLTWSTVTITLKWSTPSSKLYWSE